MQMSWGALGCQKGVSGSSKNSRKGSFYTIEYCTVCNVNRVSNSCKIGLKEYDVFVDLTYLKLFFMQNLCKSVIFLEILRT